MTPKTKNGPERLHPLEALALNPYEERELTMSLPNTPRYPRPPLAEWNATDVIVEANRRGIRASQLLATFDLDELEPQADAPRTSVGEFTANLLLIALALAVTYCAVVGAVHTLIALGMSA